MDFFDRKYCINLDKQRYDVPSDLDKYRSDRVGELIIDECIAIG